MHKDLQMHALQIWNQEWGETDVGAHCQWQGTNIPHSYGEPSAGPSA